MGLFSGLIGNASEVDTEHVEQEFSKILVEGEQIEKAFKLVRDLIVLTNKRMVLVDKQGVSGKKTEYLSIPYRSITRFSKESVGHFDLDAEFKVWVSSQHEPISRTFKKNEAIDEMYRVLAQHLLG